MKQSNKSFLFTDFKLPFKQNRISKNELIISSISNLTTQNNIIEPLYDFDNFYLTLFSKADYNQFYADNETFLKSIIYIYTYDYFDTNSLSNKSRIFVVDKNFSLYELNISTKTFTSLQTTFTIQPTFATINNKLYIFSPKDYFLLFEQGNELPLTILSLPKIKKVLYLNHQMFFLLDDEKFTFCSADDFEIEDLSATYNNFTRMQVDSVYGEILDIIIYKSNLYIIQQYGIAKYVITSVSYRLQQTCSINSKIYAETVQTIDDYIIFMTTSGLYIFDGNDIKQMFSEYTSLIRDNNYSSASYNNKYFIHTKILLNDILTNAILEFNVENEICNIYNIGEVNSLYLLKTIGHYELIVLMDNNNSYSLMNFPNKKYIKKNKSIIFNKMLFNDYENKTISKLEITGEGNYNIILSSDVNTLYLSSFGDKIYNNLGLKGHIFQLIIESDESFMINSIYITISKVEEWHDW